MFFSASSRLANARSAKRFNMLCKRWPVLSLAFPSRMKFRKVQLLPAIWFESSLQTLFAQLVCTFRFTRKVLVGLLSLPVIRTRNHRSLSSVFHLLTATALSKWSIQSSQLPYPVNSSGTTRGLVAILVILSILSFLKGNRLSTQKDSADYANVMRPIYLARLEVT